MYQIGIYDDEPVFLEHAARLVDEILSSRGIPCHIHTFQNRRELCTYLSMENNRHTPPPGEKN